MTTWLSAAELAGLPGLPGTERRVRARADREQWPWRKRAGRGGGREYSIEALPKEAKTELGRRHVAASKPLEPAAPPTAANGAVPLAGLSGNARTRAECRLAILGALRTFADAAHLGLRDAEHRFAAEYNAGRIGVDPSVFATVPRVSATSLFRWRVLAQKAGPGRLAGKYRGRREAGKIEGNPAVRNIVVSLMLEQPHLGAAQVLGLLDARVRDRAVLPSKRRLQAWMTRWRDENKVVVAHAISPDDAKNRFRPAFGSASEGIVRVNQLWEIDDTKGDITCPDGRRRTLVLVIDVATRRKMALLCDAADSAAVLRLIKRAIRAWGLPEAIKSDNGKNYCSTWVDTALQSLGVVHRVCTPFSPEQKPHVERAIGTIQHDLFEQLPGYVGHNVAERQALRGRMGFAQRFGFRDCSVGVSAEALQVACDTWCEAIDACRPRDYLGGRTPAEVAAEQAAHARWITDERALDVLMAEPAGGGWRTVGKKGIELAGTFFAHGELGPYVGQRVKLRWDEDAGRVVVYSAQGKFICVAEAAERLGVKRREHAAVGRALQAKLLTAAVEYRAELKHLVQPHRLPFEALAKAAAEHGGAVPAAQIEAIADEKIAEAKQTARELAAPQPKAPIVENVVALPERGADGKLQKPANLGDDVAYAAWLLDDKANGNDEDRAWLARMMRSWEFRQSLEINGVLKADGRAAFEMKETG